MASLSNARAPLARRMAIFVAAGTSSALFGAGCSAASTEHDSPTGASGRGNTDSSFGGSGLGVGGVKLNVSNGGAAGGARAGVTEACVTTTARAQAEPAVLELVLDISGSMAWPPGWSPPDDDPEAGPPAGTTKWEITGPALTAAVASLSAETALGLLVFPNADDCAVDDPELPITLLGAADSSAREAFATSVENISPYGGTPTEDAYALGVKYLEETELRGQKFLLLITDGVPTYAADCQGDGITPVATQPLLDAAAAAYQQGIRSFVIGSPGSEAARSPLSAMASAGHTAPSACSDQGPTYCHFDMTQQQDLSAGLATALQQIASSIVSCQYAIPTPPLGQLLDRGKVNVTFNASDGTTHRIPRDASETECNSGWQYSADGKTLQLCKDACELVNAEQRSNQGVAVVFGCVNQDRGGPPK